MGTQYYLIESLAPLVFRSGKPFGEQAYHDDANFPLPSSAAGLLRALVLEHGKEGFLGQPEANSKRARLSAQQEQALRNIACIGALLAKLNESGSVSILVPKPADAVFFKNTSTQETALIRLTPKAFDADCGSDLHGELLPVQMEEDHIKGKPESGARFWSLNDLLLWQTDPKSLLVKDLENNGLKNIPVEIRTHVALNDQSFASEDGKLFQTAGLDLGFQKAAKGDDAKPGLWSESRLAFVVGADFELPEGLATFGGERRLSHFKKVQQAVFPALDASLHHAIQQQKGFKLTFLSPAIFRKGYLPEWIDEHTLTGTLPHSAGVQVALKAVAVDRWLPVSGWDLQRWKPKAMRKAVAAGAVYWFEITSGTITQQDVERLWFKAITDDAQDQKDGFGLTTIAAWSAQ